MSPFELFGLKPQVFMDKDALDKAYQGIQSLIHPDQHSDDLAKQAALTLSARAASSYAKLKNPMKCIDMMLFELEGITFDQLALKDPETMAFVFDLQEQILDGADKTLILKQTGVTLKNIAGEIKSAFNKKDGESLKRHSLKFAYLYKFWVGH